MEKEFNIDWDNVVPDFSGGNVIIDPCPVLQTKLTFKPEYYGLKINECELTKHNITVLEIVKRFGFETWVVGRDEALGKKGIAHYHIHFKSKKNIAALRKQKQVVLPNWGLTTKLGPPRKDHSKDWFCWAGYATKELLVGMSNDITPDDKIEIAKHAHTQAVIKQSKLNWSDKQDDKKEAKKDLETRLYDILDKALLGKPEVYTELVALHFCNAYFADVGELPPATTLKSKVWKWCVSRKICSMEEYVNRFF